MNEILFISVIFYFHLVYNYSPRRSWPKRTTLIRSTKFRVKRVKFEIVTFFGYQKIDGLRIF